EILEQRLRQSDGGLSGVFRGGRNYIPGLPCERTGQIIGQTGRECSGDVRAVIIRVSYHRGRRQPGRGIEPARRRAGTPDETPFESRLVSGVIPIQRV